MLETIKNWLCCAWMPLHLGGDSSSSANQTQTTETQDNRIASAVGSANINNSRGTITGGVSLTTISTDQGTVSKAFDFANKVTAGAANEAAASMGAVQATATSAVDSVAAAYKDSNKTIADAYQTSKAGEQKILVAGALALLAIVGIKSFGKHV
jgi:hypothetical protein